MVGGVGVGTDSHTAMVPWGFWATIAFSLGIGGVFIGIQVVVGAAFVSVVLPRVPESMSDPHSSGFLLAVATCVSSPIGIGLTAVCVRMKRGWRVRDYLVLRGVHGLALLKWLGRAAVFAIASDVLTILLGRSIVPEFMARVYATAVFTPLLWIALVVAAPLFEETLFRGFLFKGFQHSRVGAIGAVVLTSLLFGVVHLQYDAYGIATAVAIGLLLGIARLKTESLYPPLAMHALLNLVATLEVALL